MMACYQSNQNILEALDLEEPSYRSERTKRVVFCQRTIFLHLSYHENKIYMAKNWGMNFHKRPVVINQKLRFHKHVQFCYLTNLLLPSSYFHMFICLWQEISAQDL